jgi:hypothetical protein
MCSVNAFRSTSLKSSSVAPVHKGKVEQLSRHSSIANALESWVRREESRVRADGFRGKRQAGDR